MEAYKFEKREWPHPRCSKALEVLALKYGIKVGYDYAEAFCLVFDR